jgi:hypothetical protein
VRSGAREARTILLFHIISARPSKHPRMVGSTLGVYDSGLIFVSARTNKRHHHHPPKTPIRSYSVQTPPRNGNPTLPPSVCRRRGGQNWPQADTDALRHPGHMMMMIFYLFLQKQHIAILGRVRPLTIPSLRYTLGLG